MVSDYEVFPPAELVARVVEGAMALATASVATEMDENRAAAYAAAAQLAQEALKAAQALQQPQESPVVVEVVALAADLAERVAQLEQQQASSS